MDGETPDADPSSSNGAATADTPPEPNPMNESADAQARLFVQGLLSAGQKGSGEGSGVLPLAAAPAATAPISTRDAAAVEPEGSKSDALTTDTQVPLKDLPPTDSQLSSSKVPPTDPQLSSRDAPPTDSQASSRDAPPADAQVSTSDAPPTDSHLPPTDSQGSSRDVPPADAQVSTRDAPPTDSQVSSRDLPPTDCQVSSRDVPRTDSRMPSSEALPADSQVSSRDAPPTDCQVSSGDAPPAPSDSHASSRDALPAGSQISSRDSPPADSHISAKDADAVETPSSARDASPSDTSKMSNKDAPPTDCVVSARPDDATESNIASGDATPADAKISTREVPPTDFPISAKGNTPNDDSPAEAQISTGDASPIDSKISTGDAAPADAQNSTGDAPPPDSQHSTGDATPADCQESIGGADPTGDAAPTDSQVFTGDAAEAASQTPTADSSPTDAQGSTAGAAPAHSQGAEAPAMDSAPANSRRSKEQAASRDSQSSAGEDIRGDSRSSTGALAHRDSQSSARSVSQSTLNVTGAVVPPQVMKQRSVIPPWYLKGESSDDEPSDPEGDLPPPVAGAMRPPATGSIREHTGRRVERLLRREAREEDEVLFWQRRLKARHLPIALLRQLAADHCRVLEDLRRRAGVQLKHEAALVVQFRTRQYLEARRHAASLPPPSAASATTAASDDPPAELSKAAHASRRFLLAASQSSSENVMVAVRSEEDLAADIELATRQLASRASLLRACELRLVVTEEAHRLFESVGVAMARKVLALRRRLHLTFHRQHREAAEAAKTGAARPRNTLVLQQIFRDQEDLVACERHLRQLCSVMLSEFSEHSMTEMKTLRGDYLGSDVSPLDPPSISLRQLYLLQARVSARLRRSPRTPQSDDVVDLVKSTHWKCTRYTLDLKQDPTKVQPVVGYSDPSSLSAAADQMPLLERARMGEMLELGGSSVHISCEVLAQRRRDETLRERNMLREKLQQLQEVQESLARCQAARPRRNSAVSSFNQRATTPPSSPPSSRAKADTHLPKLCGSCRVLCSRDLAGPPGRPGVFTRGASGPDSLARYIGHRTQSATRLADAWPGRKDEDSAHEARQPERPSTVFAHIGGSQRWKAAEVRSSREASPRHQRSPRTMAPSQSQPILPGRKLRSSHSGKLPYKVLNPQPRPLNLFQATRPKTAAGVTSPRHEGTQSQGKLPICAANRNAPIVGRVRPNYRKEGVTKSSPTVIERRTELSARPPQPENAETS